MWILKSPRKQIILPIIFVLTIFVDVLMIALNIAAGRLNFVSGIMGIVGVPLIFTGLYVGAGFYLVIAFLISSTGLPAIAERLISLLDYINLFFGKLCHELTASGQLGPKLLGSLMNMILRYRWRCLRLSWGNKKRVAQPKRGRCSFA